MTGEQVEYERNIVDAIAALERDGQPARLADIGEVVRATHDVMRPRLDVMVRRGVLTQNIEVCGVVYRAVDSRRVAL